MNLTPAQQYVYDHMVEGTWYRYGEIPFREAKNWLLLNRLIAEGLVAEQIPGGPVQYNRFAKAAAPETAQETNGEYDKFAIARRGIVKRFTDRLDQEGIRKTYYLSHPSYGHIRVFYMGDAFGWKYQWWPRGHHIKTLNSASPELLLTYGVDEPNGETAIAELFHSLWGLSADSRYDKPGWIKLQTLLQRHDIPA